MITPLHALVPDDKQVDWPAFCHKRALPLRKRLMDDPSRQPASHEIRVTRKRYDRAFLFFSPVLVAISLAIWPILGAARALVFPLLFVPFWLLLRFSTRPEGEIQTRATQTQSGRWCCVASSRWSPSC